MYFAHILFLVSCLSFTIRAQPIFTLEEDDFYPIGSPKVPDMYDDDEKISHIMEEQFRKYGNLRANLRNIGALELPNVSTAKKILKHAVKDTKKTTKLDNLSTIRPKSFRKDSNDNNQLKHNLRKNKNIVNASTTTGMPKELTKVTKPAEKGRKEKKQTRRFTDNGNVTTDIDGDLTGIADIAAAIARQGEETTLEPKEKETRNDDTYAYVALIDIMFTDDCKRSCTGAIIHDNVVITAAHCFTMVNNEFMQPELSMSFVVIGTQDMFYSGYEQYLPIERVITHPRYKGWTANLALVKTFARMQSDKPGVIIPLVTTRSSTQVDRNITVLSWGQCKKEKHQKNKRKTRSHDGSVKTKLRYELKENRGYEDLTRKAAKVNLHLSFDIKHETKTARSLYLVDSLDLDFDKRVKRPRATSQDESEVTAEIVTKPGEINISNTTSLIHQKEREDSAEKEVEEVEGIRRFGSRRFNKINDYSKFSHWRRQMSSDTPKLNLTAGVFGYVNLATCRKVIEKKLPPMYEIQNINEALCYTSEEYYITKEDSGAPVIQNDELIAITVGGVDSAGQHVAVGIKIACFCSWIADNLPNNAGATLNCCSDCCDNKKDSKRKQMNSDNLLKKRNGLFQFVNVPSSSESSSSQNEDHNQTPIKLSESDSLFRANDKTKTEILITTEDPSMQEQELSQLKEFYDMTQS